MPSRSGSPGPCCTLPLLGGKHTRLPSIHSSIQACNPSCGVRNESGACCTTLPTVVASVINWIFSKSWVRANRTPLTDNMSRPSAVVTSLQLVIGLGLLRLPPARSGEPVCEYDSQELRRCGPGSLERSIGSLDDPLLNNTQSTTSVANLTRQTPAFLEYRIVLWTRRATSLRRVAPALGGHRQ